MWMIRFTDRPRRAAHRPFRRTDATNLSGPTRKRTLRRARPSAATNVGAATTRLLRGAF
jgi:hypothetical protein